jgi:hypothetical protein
VKRKARWKVVVTCTTDQLNETVGALRNVGLMPPDESETRSAGKPHVFRWYVRSNGEDATRVASNHGFTEAVDNGMPGTLYVEKVSRRRWFRR